jgi:hypothetical protein
MYPAIEVHHFLIPRFEVICQFSPDLHRSINLLVRRDELTGVDLAVMLDA